MSGPNRIAAAFDTFNRVRLQSPTLEKIWREGFGAEYASEARPDAFYPQAVLERIVHAVTNLEPPPGILLDVGCGHGLTGLYLARRLRRNLYGVDISAASIELAAENARDRGQSIQDFEPEAKFAVAEASAIGLKDGECGIAVCMDVMLYFPDKLAALTEIARVLKPGGIFAFTTWEQKGYNPRLGAAQVDDYRPLLLEAGFEVEYYDAVDRAGDLQGRVLAGLIEHEDVLKTEVGEEAAAMLAGMARSAREEAPDRRYVLGIVRRRG